MCSCEPGWVCASCRDTRNDDSYPENEREQESERQYSDYLEAEATIATRYCGG